MDNLCPFCLQRNPHPDHIASHAKSMSPLAAANASMIAKHIAAELNDKKKDGSIPNP